MNISGVTDYSFLFQDTSTNSLFGNTGAMLGEYSMIRSGVYKKLLNAYYTKELESESENSSGKTQNANDKTKTEYVNLKNDALELSDSANALDNGKLYEATGVDEQGNKVYDRDAIEKGVKQFVSDYNSFMEQAKESDAMRVSGKALSMAKETASNSKILQDIGITIGNNNTLVLDEKKLKTADISDLTTLFRGNTSYGDEISTKASEAAKLANSAAYSNSAGASYNGYGGYSSLGTSSSVLDQYL